MIKIPSPVLVGEGIFLFYFDSKYLCKYSKSSFVKFTLPVHL